MRNLNRREFLNVGLSGIGLVALNSIGAGGCETTSGVSLENAVFGEQGISETVYKGIPIKFDGIRLPTSWTLLHDFEYSPVAEFDRAGKLGGIERELDVHPEGLLKEYVNTVYVLGSLTVQGNPWGGSRTQQGDLFVVFPQIFQGEFSSLLYLNNPNRFPHATWQGANPVGFVYQGYDQSQPIPDGNTHFTDPALLAQGFIGPYGLWTEEEDFNLFAEKLFTDPARLLIAAAQYPRIAEKTELTVGFYNNVSGQSMQKEDFLRLRGRDMRRDETTGLYLPANYQVR